MRSRSYFGDKINRIKLYKKGKFWVAASMTFISLGLGFTTTVHANPVELSSSASTSSQLTSSSKVTLSSSIQLKSDSVSGSSKNESSTEQLQASSASVQSSSSSDSISASKSSSQVSSSASSSLNASSQETSSSSVIESSSSKQTSSVNEANKLNSSATSNEAAINSSLENEDQTSSRLTNNVDVSLSTTDNSLQPTTLTNRLASVSNFSANTPVALFASTPSQPNSSLTNTNAMPVSFASSYNPADDYGAWTFFFQDMEGVMVGNPTGLTDASASEAKNFVTPYVKEIENEGYAYNGCTIYHSYIGSYSYNYITIDFKPSPLVEGGAVTVQYKDAVTGKIIQSEAATYKDRAGNVTSTPYVGCDYTTSAKNIVGYTLTSKPSNAKGKITSSAQTVTYLYAPNNEKVQIQFVDDSENGKIMNTVNVSGTFGSTSTFDVQSYIKQNYPNYNLEYNSWPGSITWDTSNDQTVPLYVVKLTHKIQNGTDTRNVTQTITYQYQNGGTAEPTKTTTITFTRPMTTDLATGQKTYGQWTNQTGSTEFPSVVSPQIEGYTPSYSQTNDITGITPDSPDNNQTIIYVPNKEAMTIVYYDMDANKILKEDTLQGDYGTSPTYDYQSIINSYTSKGYNIAKNSIPSTGLKFDNSGNQQYEVDFTHTQIKLPANSQGLTGVVTHVIHYVDTDGNSVAKDVVQTITYTRSATQDMVTGQITYGDWKTTTDPAVFPSVDSPDVPGYTPSQAASGDLPVTVDFPDSASVNFPTENQTIVYTKNQPAQNPTAATTTVTETISYLSNTGVTLSAPTTLTITFNKNADGTYTAEGNDDFPAVVSPTISGYTTKTKTVSEVDNVKATDANINKVVIYSPQQSMIVINYYDETTGKSLKTDTLFGDYNTSPNYDANAYISVLEKKGYEEDTAKSALPSSLIYTNTTQVYNMYFKHTYKTSTQTVTVTQTINYTYPSGAQAASPVNKSLTFSRQQTQDVVTGTIQNGQWSPQSGSFPAVKSPVIPGYTPTKVYSDAINNVDGSTTNDVQNIVYNPNTETIDVQYVDQTTGKVIRTVPVTGPYESEATYTTDADIKSLESQGFDLVSDGYPKTGVKFDEDGVVKTFTVTMKENVTTSTESKTVTQTIHYVDSNGNPIASDATNSITFTRTDSTNHVTGITTDGDWSPATGTFKPVVSPTITGYTVTPGQESSKEIDDVTATSGNDVQTITYKANQERAVVKFVDSTTNTTLSTVNLSGAYGTTDSYNPATTIANYINQGYQMTGDTFPPQGVQYNYDGTVPTYTITFDHATRTDTVDNNPDNVAADELTKNVKQTINYVYANGSNAKDPVTNTVTFNRSVTVDQVTHQIISEGSWTPATGTFPSVTSPTITGYTPSIAATTANTNVQPTDSDSSVTVTYRANSEHAIVNYVDDVTGKIVTSQQVNGVFGRSTTYDPTNEEDILKNEGYTIGSNDLPSGNTIVFNQDGQVPTYTIHLGEGTTTYTPTYNPSNLELTHNVNQTIHYKYSNGDQAKPDVTNSIQFTRNATKNNVSGVITYSNWTPTDQTFPAVQSPVITGYTPNKAQSDVVSDVNENTPDNTQTITYTANPEHAVVNYVDDVTGKTVASQTVDGTFGSTTTYDPTTEENTLKDQGYTIGSTDLPTGDQITFSQDGQVPTYTVHLNEGTTTYTPDNNPEKLELTHSVNQTIHYKYSNGDQAKPDATTSIQFTRTATKNNVTGTITYTDWTPTNQTFPAVKSPVITGYTPDKAQSEVVSDVNENTTDNVQTVTYTANPEHAVVNYVDDVTGKTVASETVNGTFGGTTTYDPTTEENTLKGKGYTIGSNNLPSNDQITFSQDGQVPTYTVHLNEGTTTYTPDDNPEKLELTHNVNQTIHYQYSNGTSAHADATNSIAFTRNATKNNVTGAITYTNWTPTDQTFPAVASPTITGYTPNKAQSDVVSDVNENTPDNTQTITYTANPEHAIVNYVDDVTGKTVASETVNGTFDGTTTYDPTTEENTLKGEGYEIGSNNLPSGNKITFSQDGQVPTYTVHLNEGTTTYTPNDNPEKLELTHNVNQTIHYKYSNGTQAYADAKNTIQFTRNATKNNVTGVITYTNWTPTDQTFPAVQSPSITGYTPNKTQSDVVSDVNEDTADNTQTITYTANAEHAVVNYVDDNTGKTVASETVNGTFGNSTVYDPTTEEDTLKGKGYEIGSNNLPSGNKITFSQDGQVPTYTVHLTEGTTTYTPNNNPEKLELTHSVNQTIHYQYSNGTQAHTDATNSITFTRNATKNNVTGTITYTDWTPINQTFQPVASPTITGYTPNATASAPVEGVNENSQDNTQTITYTANPEHAVVNYVDDATGKTVASQTVNGTFGNSTTYDPTSEENTLKGEGYTIGSNDLPTGNKITFTQDGQVPTYTVHLNESTTTYTPSNNPEKLDLSHTINQTIHYVYSNGGQAAPDVTKSVTFTRSATKNNVTNAITYTDWTPANSSFPAVTSPTVTGYTPNASASAPVSLTENSQNNTQVITYKANAEHAVVNYVDDATGKTVASQTVNGTFGGSTTYDPTAEENTLKGKGYTIGSNDLPSGNKITFSQDGNVPTYTVHLNESTTTYTPNDNPEKLDLTHVVNQTIHYQYSDGSQAKPDVTNSITFTRNATKNNVTGTITYTNWTPSDQQFPAVTTPTITGYTPSKSASDVVNDVNEDSKDNTQTITYTANAEHAVVNYVDDVTGKTVASQTVDGTFGNSTTYDPTSEENTLKNDGYTIGSNNLPAGNKITFSQDGQVPTYTVHLNEGTTTYTPNDNPEKLDLSHTVNQTIHYKYSNGNQASPDATKSITFTRNATKNNVTGAITYTDWTPSDQQFPAVTSPTITGYTPSKSASDVVSDVNEDSKDNTQTITYTANSEHAVVNYVDDVTGKTVASQTVNGTFGNSTTYDPTDEENTLKGEGYTVGNSDLPSGNKITFNQDGNVPTYTVHLNEGTTTFTPNDNPDNLDLSHTINQTIHYVYSDGSQAAPDAKHSITFTRDATKNNVTGTITYTNWTPSDSNFPAVASPTITGYTPNESESQPVNDVTESSKDDTQTITYLTNAEKVVIDYVDDDTGKVVDSQTIGGKFGRSTIYDPTSEENTLKNEGYTVGSSDLPADDKITFNQDGREVTYTVHLNEGKTTYTPSNNPENLDLSHTVNQTIQYFFNNGDQAAPDVKRSVTFTRTAVKNDVTGEITYTNWTPSDQTFSSVTSPTITGYTPSKVASTAVDVNESSKDNTQTIIYSPSAEHAVVNYVDDTTGKTVASQTVDGTFGNSTTYDPTSEENTLKNDGYTIGNSNLPSDDQITFNKDGQVPTYTVHLTEGTTTYTPNDNPEKLDLTHTVNQTIHYVYSDGTQAAPDVKRSITFTRNAIENKVTGAITFTNWTPNDQQFPAVTSPTITGYVPDKAESDPVDNVNADTEDNTQTIIYKANQTHAVVNYVDDDTGKTVSSQIVDGTVGGSVTYDPTSEENTLRNQGYVVGKSDLPNNDQITFGKDSNIPTYTVHLTEGTVTYTPDNNPDELNLTHTVNQTIHYVYSNGSQAAPDVKKSITFTRSATENKVTGKITYTEWTPSDQQFPAVTSPVIQGYKPSQMTSDPVNDVNEDTPDNTQTITYTATAEHAIVNYVDDTTGKTITSQTVDGNLGSSTTYDPTSEENTLKNEGYVVGKSDLPAGNKITFTQDGQVPTYTIHLTEGTTTYTPSNNPEKLDLTHTVNQTIHYVYSDGTQAAPDVKKSVTFTRTAVKNNVTGKITYTNWTPSDQQFPAVTSPTITGYTPSKLASDVVSDVNENSQDNVQTITYTANTEHAVVNYVDDTTGKTITSQTVNGTFGNSTTYDPTSEENTLKNEGYVVGKSDLPAGNKITFTQDGQVPTYTIHLTEGTTTYTPSNNPEKLDLTHTVNQTIHYVYSDGTQAAPDVKKSVTFTRTAVKNNVTGKITYTSWTPSDQQFPAVTSPVIDGYTPSATESTPVDVTENSQDNMQTITYTANVEQTEAHHHVHHWYKHHLHVHHHHVHGVDRNPVVVPMIKHHKHHNRPVDVVQTVEPTTSIKQVAKPETQKVTEPTQAVVSSEEPISQTSNVTVKTSVGNPTLSARIAAVQVAHTQASKGSQAESAQLPQTGEHSANENTLGIMLIGLSGILAVLGLAKKKEKED